MEEIGGLSLNNMKSLNNYDLDIIVDNLINTKKYTKDELKQLKEINIKMYEKYSQKTNEKIKLFMFHYNIPVPSDINYYSFEEQYFELLKIISFYDPRFLFKLFTITEVFEYLNYEINNINDEIMLLEDIKLMFNENFNKATFLGNIARTPHLLDTIDNNIFQNCYYYIYNYTWNLYNRKKRKGQTDKLRVQEQHLINSLNTLFNYYDSTTEELKPVRALNAVRALAGNPPERFVPGELVGQKKPPEKENEFSSKRSKRRNKIPIKRISKRKNKYTTIKMKRNSLKKGPKKGPKKYSKKRRSLRKKSLKGKYRSFGRNIGITGSAYKTIENAFNGVWNGTEVYMGSNKVPPSGHF